MGGGDETGTACIIVVRQLSSSRLASRSEGRIIRKKKDERRKEEGAKEQTKDAMVCVRMYVDGDGRSRTGGLVNILAKLAIG